MAYTQEFFPLKEYEKGHSLDGKQLIAIVEVIRDNWESVANQMLIQIEEEEWQQAARMLRRNLIEELEKRSQPIQIAPENVSDAVTDWITEHLAEEILKAEGSTAALQASMRELAKKLISGTMT